MFRQKLIHGDVGDDLHFVPSAALGAGQKRSGSAGVDIIPARLESGEHQGLIAIGRERLQNRRKLESRSLAAGSPIFHGHAIGHVERLKAVHRLRGTLPAQREGREHRIQKRQRQGSADTSQYGPPWQSLRSQESHVYLLLKINSTPWRVPTSRKRGSRQSP